MSKKIVALAAAALLGGGGAGCVSTEEMPLAPNMVRLDTHAAGALFVGQATGQTMRRAAELTLQNGYTHFRLEQAQMSQGSQFAGTSTYNTGSAIATGYGNSAFVSGSSSGFSTPIYARTADVGVTVIMFHGNEAGAKGAFNAAEVLKRYSQ
jgi:hypothetical protein